MFFLNDPTGDLWLEGSLKAKIQRAPQKNLLSTCLLRPQSADQFVLPGLYAVLPFEGRQNPFFDVVGRESRDWVNSYHIIPHHSQSSSTSGELLACCCCCSFAPHDVFRVCADFINVSITLDEVSDVRDSDGAREAIHLFVRVSGSDPDCDDGSPLARMPIKYVISDHFFTFIPHELICT